MPVKTDAGGKRWVEVACLLPGSPAQLWAAVATGPGLAAWFTPAEVEPRVGGDLTLRFGPGLATTGTVTAWEPPARFGYVEVGWDAGAPPCSTEITIAARADGQCLLRLAHAIVTPSDAWDDQLESFERGWPAFFEVLRVYLAAFSGQPAASYQLAEETALPGGRAWRRLVSALGLADLDAGDTRTIVAGPEAWEAVVETIHQTASQRTMLVRIDGPAPGLAVVGVYAAGEVRSVGLTRFYYGAGVAAGDAGERAWREWLGAIAG